MLKDNDDYQGIVSILQACCASLAPLTIDEGFILSLSGVIQAYIFLQNENLEPEKTKKKTQKELKIEKAKATATAQNEADGVIAELKITHPVCFEHCTHCWLGHPSGKHVTLSEM